MTSASYAPGRGDLVWLAFDPQAGHEQAGRRPALVIAPREYNSKVGLAVLCPVTTAVKGYPFEVAVPKGLAVGGVVLSDQLKSLDWRARKAKYICTLPEAVTAEVLARVRTLVT